MKQGFEVVVIGAVGIDTNVYTNANSIDFVLEASFTENLDYIGMAGGYSSKGFARLGKKTAFIGFVGDDYMGRHIASELQADGIDTKGVFLDPMGTKRSVNLIFRDGTRKSFYDGKGSMHLKPDLETCRRILSGSKFAHFNIVNWSRYLLPIAKEEGLIISVDLQDIVDIDDTYRRDYVEFADVLFFSCVNFDDPTPFIKTFLEKKKDRIVISGMGKRGCAVGTKDGITFFPVVELQDPVVDTTGAGDSLAVGFLSSYLLDNYSLEDSIMRGQIAARYCCTKKASSSELITVEELDQFYRSFKA
ncbi:carbohydrate kinase [Kosmotoga arenicorallina S304]|uniref:Carbohydrate kinase n=1 Tax=Kosmotoga arenicorallina S304 TaxID=1453497 RepID=A0A176K0P1_9BACT|nr:carbohydrate kinase family protein [Kosmotoga arenicorallina]OAA30393.1 carbohydrate kinase [Kosmotoga arenicorallina S304]